MDTILKIIEAYNKAMASNTAATFGSIIFGGGLYLIAYYTQQARTNIVVEVSGVFVIVHGVARMYLNLYKDTKKVLFGKAK